MNEMFVEIDVNNLTVGTTQFNLITEYGASARQKSKREKFPVGRTSVQHEHLLGESEVLLLGLQSTELVIQQ